MTKIDLATNKRTLPQLLQLAGEDDVVLETLEGRKFALVEIDDFADEIAAVVKHKPLMKLLAERSKEASTIPLSQVRARLNGKKKTLRKPRKAKTR